MSESLRMLSLEKIEKEYRKKQDSLYLITSIKLDEAVRGRIESSTELTDKLIDIIKVRTNLVKEVVKLKEFKNEIVDKKRISIILKKIKKKSISKNIDPKITNRIWKNMIWSYINYERKVFKKK